MPAGGSFPILLSDVVELDFSSQGVSRKVDCREPDRYKLAQVNEAYYTDTLVLGLANGVRKCSIFLTYVPALITGHEDEEVH